MLQAGRIGSVGWAWAERDALVLPGEIVVADLARDEQDFDSAGTGMALLGNAEKQYVEALLGIHPVEQAAVEAVGL